MPSHLKKQLQLCIFYSLITCPFANHILLLIVHTSCCSNHSCWSLIGNKKISFSLLKQQNHEIFSSNIPGFQTKVIHLSTILWHKWTTDTRLQQTADQFPTDISETATQPPQRERKQIFRYFEQVSITASQDHRFILLAGF